MNKEGKMLKRVALILIIFGCGEIFYRIYQTGFLERYPKGSAGYRQGAK